MELREHWLIIKKAKWFILVFSLLVVGIAVIFAVCKPITYTASLAFEIELNNRVPSADYQYGSYYDLKGAEMFTQHVMSWLITPAVVKEIYAKAGLSPEIKSLAKFSHRFKAKQYSSQNFIVNFTDYSQEQATNLAKAIGEVIKAKNTNSQFKIMVSEPVVAKNQLNWIMVIAISLVSGLVVSLLLVYLKRYFSL